MQKRLKSFDGTKINYSYTKGKGVCLVFLHGLGVDLTHWKKEIQFFKKKGFSTLAIDLRGHGLSDRPVKLSSYKLSFFAKDVHEVLRKEKIKNFILIGHSFGGVVLLRFHKLCPKLAKAYIIIDSTYKAPHQVTFLNDHPYLLHFFNYLLEHEDLRKMHFSHIDFKEFVGTGDWDLRGFLTDIHHTSLRSWLFTLEHMARFNGLDVLQNIKQPVLVIEGTKDTIFDVKIAKTMHHLIKGSKLDLIKGADHVLLLNKVKKLEHDMYKYLSKIENYLE